MRSSPSRVTAMRAGSFKPTEPIPGVGRDARFIGTAISLPLGTVSAPFEGARGYFVIKVTNRTAIDSAQFAMQRPALRDQVLQEQRNRFMMEWQRSLRESATIEDHRDRFYR